MSPPTPSGYAERVYAGVLGKIIGVYAGAPVEGWSHERIVETYGAIDRFVHAESGRPVVAPDDDITGTFTFFRALEASGFDPDLTPQRMGEQWLDSIIEGRTILWWGGMGVSTEHTAYLRLKDGVPAPESGSIARNGRQVAEQIGAQIFIDAWGLLCPGDPERAADFARRAASVSHDGEAVYAAQAIAALVALAFVETEMDALFDRAYAFIPTDSVIARAVGDVHEWHAKGLGWRDGFVKVRERYGYDKFPGACHVVPNHTVVAHALLHGGGRFGQTVLIANTCGWDTDCNSGNAGCIAGVLGGIDGLQDGYDWRAPVGDRLYLPSADAGRCVSDAVRETVAIVEAHHRLSRQPYDRPKGGARFSFCFPGSMQGFAALGASLSNPGGALEVRLSDALARAITPTFPPDEAFERGGYAMVASPSLYPGQTLRGRVRGEGRARLVAAGYDATDAVVTSAGPWEEVTDCAQRELTYRLPPGAGYPVFEAGLEFEGRPGALFVIDWLTWSGEPEADLSPRPASTRWRRAWAAGVTEMQHWLGPMVLVQNGGGALVTQGEETWRDVTVEATLRPVLARSIGVAAWVMGTRRHVALVLEASGVIRLIATLGAPEVLAEAEAPFNLGEPVTLSLACHGSAFVGAMNGREVVKARARTPDRGAIGVWLEEGCCEVLSCHVRPTHP